MAISACVFGLRGSPFLVALIILVLRFAVQPCAGLAGGFTSGGRARVAQENRATATADVYYVTKTADKFASFSAWRRRAVDEFHYAEQARLERAIQQASRGEDKSLLEVTATFNEESRLEAQNAFNEMQNFVTTLKQSMGAVGSAASCQDLMCGTRAFCAESAAEGVRCRCEEGYEGNGFVCNPPTNPSPHTLIYSAPNQPPPQVADLDITMLPGNVVVVAYRDVNMLHRGFLMVGGAEVSRMRWGAPACFSGSSQAFGPALVGLDGVPGGLAIAYRDENRGGSGFLLGARVDQATLSLVNLSVAKPFARHLAQGTSLVAFPQSRVAVFFAEHVLGGVAGRLSGGAMYGAALLAQVPAGGAAEPQLLGKHRFEAGPVARIHATRVSPSSFVVAYRRGESAVDNNAAPRPMALAVAGHGATAALIDSAAPTRESAEASCILGQLRGSELVFEPQPVLLEPGATQIWARSVALVQENVISYTYHSGNEQLTKQAILSADPVTRRLTVLRQPEVIGRGFTPYVGTLSTALVQGDAAQPVLLQEEGPRLLTYYSHGSSGHVQARMCKVNGAGVPMACTDLDWPNQEVLSAAGAPVGDGRLLLVFTDVRGAPHYQLIGLLEDAL